MRLFAEFYYFALVLGTLSYPESEQNFNIGDVDIKCFVRGPKDGKPVILLHGNGGSHKKMRTQAMQLARAGYLVYSPDSRGQGANTPLNEYHYSDMMEDTREIIRRLGLKRPAIFGWSDGGIIALMLESTYPGTCGPICASGANLTPDCGPDFEEFKAWILEQGTPLALMMLHEPDIDPKTLKAIKAPCLITCGSKDLISVEHTKLIADSIPGSELVVFEGENHGSYIKKSPKIGKCFLDFLHKHTY